MRLKPDCVNFRAAVLVPAIFAVSANVVHAAGPADANSAADAASPADAADSADLAAASEVIVTGTRQSGVTAADSAAPIQIVSAQTLEKVSGKPDLITSLAAIVPSFTAQSFGGDQANQTLQAKLRGLSPNDVLVLINGKRRHTTANLEVLSGAYQGGAAADLNFIPVEAIDHIEVLTEGAAAQYGSDAIAGVINIILKKDPAGGNLAASYGAYEDGGGSTEDIAGNAGFEPLENSFLNLTAEVRNHGHSNRGAVDPRVVNPTSYPNTNELSAPGYPYLNQIEGDGAYHLTLLTLNAGFDLGGDTQFYLFGTWGKKDSNSYENYRLPNKVLYKSPAGITTYPFPFGFDPLEAIRETDYGITGGLKGTLAGWNWDIASTYGYDHDDVYTLNSSNASLFALNDSSPTDFYDGFFKSTQWTSTIDINRDFPIGLAGPLNIAFGGEYRRDTYAIGAGNPASYYGGGAQSYPGFNPPDAGDNSRKNYAGYVDFAVKPVDALRVDLAGRYEHYTDFGSKAVGKLTARYDFAPQFAVRATVSTGFRAPTLAEEFYTTTNVSPTSAVVQLAPNSRGARDLGLGAGLSPETSNNVSFGFVFQPLANLLATLDVYQIDIRNRIVASGTINAAVGGQVVAPAVTQAIIDNGNSLDPDVVAKGQTAVSLFTNGINTKTRGADFSGDYVVDFGRSKLDWSMGVTYNDTTASEVRSGPASLAGQQLFDQTAISDLTTASPKFAGSLGALWTIQKLSINVRETIYGPASEWVNDSGATVTGKVTYYRNTISTTPITNIDLAYQALKSLTFSVGAINAFNRYPNHVNGDLTAAYYKAGSNSAVAQYPSFTPFGFNGGFYYVRAFYSF
jgi:iron complex outermembrane receptor protein